ncbi:MAG: transporter substrate-binding domain-containing protein, partial [Proteobacteria bacterium]|nr:transporter substrate-binding domain-containing protein [Pseudomonadota bacterium]
MQIVKQSTLEHILQKGELRVGFEAGYMPFEMTDKNGNFVGFDIDIAREMAQALGVKFVPVNTAWDGIIPSLIT